MRFATWNVNSVRARLPRLVGWLESAQPDVVCLQETKCTADEFPTADVERLGYEVAAHGDGRWNGVALLSRVGIADVQRGIGQGASEPPYDEARCISAVCGDVRFVSVYVPNGRSLDSPHYAVKLEWLDRLRRLVDATAAPDDPLVVAGDMNVAPSDVDVWNPSLFVGSTHVTPAERAGVQALVDWGLRDVVRDRHPEPARVFTYWDYRQGFFRRGFGMRIDLVLATAPVADAVTSAEVDVEARRGEKPSDHAPIVVETGDIAVKGAGTSS